MSAAFAEAPLSERSKSGSVRGTPGRTSSLQVHAGERFSGGDEAPVPGAKYTRGLRSDPPRSRLSELRRGS